VVAPVVSAKLEIRNSLGLHVRPATELAKLARRFQAAVRLKTAGGEIVDARSILELMTLGLEQGSQVEVDADGPDEAAALAAVCELINGGFGET
jgi:phosphotransferase system HPr (HPr) family protein